MRRSLRLLTFSFALALLSNFAAAQDDILAPGAKPELLQEKGAGEGPAWHPTLGLLTSGEGHVMRRDRDGKMSIYRENAGTNGLLFDRQGRLVMCEPRHRSVSRIELNGDRNVLAERLGNMRFNQPNDIAIDSKNRIYFSDPQYGDRSRMELCDSCFRYVEGVYRIDPNGEVSTIIWRDHGIERPNGLVITPDDKYLYVADNNNNTIGGARKLKRFELNPDGTVVPGRRTLIYDWKTTRGPDGMKLDAKGRLFVAAGVNKPNQFETADPPSAGIYVFSPEGTLLQFIPISRDETTNCAFGGDDLCTLFVTAGGTLWSIRVNTPGAPVWPAVK